MTLFTGVNSKAFDYKSPRGLPFALFAASPAVEAKLPQKKRPFSRFSKAQAYQACAGMIKF
jgi:hypothetical protein